MDGFQGAILNIKLKHLERWTEGRIFLAERYQKRLAGLSKDFVVPQLGADRRHVWHLFVALHPQRDRIRTELEQRGIATGLHYPIPVHLQKAYAHLGHKPGDFPMSERVGRECLTLPLWPEMTVQQHDQVCDALADVLKGVAQ
jgi:dTDP-4-amino-4,6-dideoxygalactose transaminase